MKKTVISRVSAVVLGLAVFSLTAVPSFAYTADWTSDVALIATLYYSDGTYDMEDTGVVFDMPVVGDDVIGTPVPPDVGKTISSIRSNVHIYNPPAEERVRLAVTFYSAVGNKNLTSNCAIQAQSNDGSWHSLPFTIISSRSSFISTQNYNDYVIEFSIPSGIERIAVYATWSIPGGYKVSEVYPVMLGCTHLAFVPINPVVDQDGADKEATDDLGGSVSDKTEESDSLLDEIGSITKPSVNVNPMQGLDLNVFRSFTNVLAIPFESPYIVWMFVTALSFSLIAYVLFGKGG